MQNELIHPDIASSPARLAIYNQVMATDGSSRFAEMCALQSPPGTKNTDRAFCEGARREMDQMDPDIRRHIVEKAEKAGIKTQGKFYKSMSAGGDGLGGYDDPGSWVSCAEDVITVAKARNLEVSGVVNTKAINHDIEPQRVKLAEDIVQRQMGKLLKAEPATAEKVKKNPKALGEVRERVIAKHSRKK